MILNTIAPTREIAIFDQPPALRVVSLFAGCGGFDLGFTGGFEHLGVSYERLPYQIVWANDIDIDAKAAYEANQNKYLGAHPFVCDDIKNVDASQVPDFDILLAGFPCQPFSNAGNRNGINDARGTLFEEVERFVKAKKPKAFVLENVKGILSSKMPDGTPIPLEIRRRLSVVKCDDGEIIRYDIPLEKLVKTEAYGVPQQRHRVLIVGIRQDDLVGPSFDFASMFAEVKKASLGKVKLRYVLENLPPDAPHLNEHWGLSPQAAKMAQMIKRSWKDIPYEDLPPRFQRIRDEMKKYRAPNFYRRFGLDEINGTITASAQPENCGILHPLENRRYTVREIARIQSFPDDYLFPCKTIEGKYKVVGNAVPPVLAFVLAKTLYAKLSPSPLSKISVEQLTFNLF